jgi:cytochrome c oxidase subunit 1
VFINATIYMAVIAVYEILPVYAKREWKVSRWFLGAWTASTLMVLIVYPHHLLMDFALPRWMHVMGQIVSYTSGIPVLLVTALGALALVYRAGVRWDLPAKLLMLAVFGWAAGVVPAIVDGTIRINLVMHNTLWVPGHFHFYLLLGLFPMILAFTLFTGGHREGRAENPVDKGSFVGFLAGGLIFVLAFLFAGQASVPRRFAVHLEEWLPYDQWGAVGSALVVLTVLVFALRGLGRLGGIRI